ncbi:MAG: hypothetical protein K1000chlam4_00078, partial [Chlamydiae bacterium]|nr:hypothetical protein [Chlamydiota bacterium]
LVHERCLEYGMAAPPRIRAVDPDRHVDIAGQGDLELELMGRASSLCVALDVRLVGNVERDELNAYYALATVVAVPSIRDDAGNVDGLPNVLLEAMASGSPLVASAVAGIPQAVRDKKEALLVAERDPEALAGAILELLESPELRKNLGASARQKRAVPDRTVPPQDLRSSSRPHRYARHRSIGQVPRDYGGKK